MKKIVAMIMMLFMLNGCTMVYVSVLGNNNSATVVSDEGIIDEPIQGFYGAMHDSATDNNDVDTKTVKFK